MKNALLSSRVFFVMCVHVKIKALINLKSLQPDRQTILNNSKEIYMDKKNEAGAQDVLAKIENFSDTYRAVAKQLHELIMATAPQLQPRLWYGMPGYALKSDGPVVLFFREDKYISFGFTENTNLTELGSPEDGLVDAAWYLSKLDTDAEAKIADIVRKVVA